MAREIKTRISVVPDSYAITSLTCAMKRGTRLFTSCIVYRRDNTITVESEYYNAFLIVNDDEIFLRWVDARNELDIDRFEGSLDPTDRSVKRMMRRIEAAVRFWEPHVFLN